MRDRRICLTDQEYEKNKQSIIHKFEEKGSNKEELEKVGGEVGTLTIREARKRKLNVTE